MKRCLQALIGDSAFLSTSHPTTLGTNHASRSYRRSYVSASQRPRYSAGVGRSYRRSYASIAERGRYSSGDLTSAEERKPGIASSSAAQRFKKGAVSTSFDRQAWLESRGVTPIHKQREKKTEDQVIKKQLSYLKDPLKLADHVRKTLREDDFDNTLALVRAASKNIQCVVSWNHLIDWQLSKGKMNAAIKTYNEVFKHSFLWQKRFLISPVLDEKKSPDSRCLYLHHNFQRLRRASISNSRSCKSNVDI